VSELRAALDTYQRQAGRFPDSLVELEVARVANVLPDPWGNPYVLLYASGAPVVVCTGADGALGGTGDDADITSDGSAPKPTLRNADR
jgi:general secretion pathway protein G